MVMVVLLQAVLRQLEMVQYEYGCGHSWTYSYSTHNRTNGKIRTRGSQKHVSSDLVCVCVCVVCVCVCVCVHCLLLLTCIIVTNGEVCLFIDSSFHDVHSVG